MDLVLAEQFIRKMRGNSQPALLRCSDGNYYIVKFRNNPQHTRVLVNEYIAAKLALRIGLPVADAVVVQVSKELIRNSPELAFRLPDTVTPVPSGLHLGIRYAIMPGEGEVLDFIPPTSMARVANVRTFAGMLPFDIWMGNTDQRQAVFWKMHTAWHLNACFIDHGFCLSGPRWEFLEHKPGRALYSDRTVYKDIHNWDSFSRTSAPSSTHLSPTSRKSLHGCPPAGTVLGDNSHVSWACCMSAA